MKSSTKVNQALIMAGGLGTRLGLGTKSHILYKGKIVLEYLIESCVRAGIKNLVVNLTPKNMEGKIESEKVDRFEKLKIKYPNIKFVRGQNLSFREEINELRSHLDESKPFYLLCGQSPQSSLFLKQLSDFYETNSIVCSGYKKRHDYIVSIGKTKGSEIETFTNLEVDDSKKFKAKPGEVITHFPYILDFRFYDKYLKSDNYKDRLEFYPKRLLHDGGKVFFALNPILLSELDYKEELPELFKSIDLLIKTNYQL